MFIDSTISAINFANDKKSIRPILIFFNLIFCAIISSWIFERVYFKYDLLDITNYKGIYDFIFRGKFLVPVIIFVIVWMFTEYIFIFYNENRRRRRSKWIKGHVGAALAKPNGMPEIKEKAIEAEILVPKNKIKFKKAMSNNQLNLEQFILLQIRFLIIEFCFFFQNPYFGSFLFVGSIILLLIVFGFSLFFDLYFEVLPETLVTVLTVEKFLSEKKEKGSSEAN